MNHFQHVKIALLSVKPVRELEIRVLGVVATGF